MMSLLLCCITVGSCVHVYKHFSAHCWVSGPVGCPGIDVCSNTIACIQILGSCGVPDSAPNRRTTVCQYGQFSLCTQAKLRILRGFRRWGAIKESIRCSATGGGRPNERLILRLHQSWQER
jgi:hypothetical protein